MEHGAATTRRSVAVWTLFALAAMVLAILAVSAAVSRAQAQSAAQGQYGQAAAATGECSETRQVRTFGSAQDTTTEPFRITSNRFRLAIQTEQTGANSEVTVNVLDEQGKKTGQRITVRGGDDAREIVPLGPGTFRLEIQANNARYNIAVQECVADAQAEGEVTKAEETTSEETTSEETTAEATTSNANAANDETTDRAQVDNVRAGSAAALNCVDILRFFRASGASGAQYQYKDLKLERNRDFDVVSDQRLQECLAREVIDRDAVKGAKLADTGGAPLLPIAAFVLVGVGILVGRPVLSSRRD